MIKLLKKINRWRIDKTAFLGRAYERRAKGPKAVVLLYHRVTSLSNDPLMLAVSPSTFADQLTELKKHFEIVSISELLDRLDTKTLKGTELAITFDDGYRDNMTEALPIAEAKQVPMTIFVATGALSVPSLSYPWDGLYSNTSATYLNEDDIRTLSSHPLVTIGAHTKSHPRLRILSPEKQGEEIQSSKQTLELLTGTSIQYFAYPYGGKLDFTKETERQAKSKGMRAAFATGDRIVTYRSNHYAIPRINVRECSGIELVDKVKHYLYS